MTKNAGAAEYMPASRDSRICYLVGSVEADGADDWVVKTHGEDDLLDKVPFLRTNSLERRNLFG